MRRGQKKRLESIKRLPRCKAKLPGLFNSKVQCGRHIKTGHYCYQHREFDK